MGVVDDRYITLATSSKPELTAAITGSFSGPNGVESALEWSIEADIQKPAVVLDPV
jgi:hypothetical protein